MRRDFIPLFVLVIAVAGGIIFGSRKVSTNNGKIKQEEQSSGVSLKEYTNDELGISFTYPSDYKVGTAYNWCSSETTCTFDDVVTLEWAESPVKQLSILKYADSDPGVQELKQQMRLKIGEADLSKDRKIVRVEDSQVGGQKAYMFYSFFGSGFGTQAPFVIVIVPYKNDYFLISYSDSDVEGTKGMHYLVFPNVLNSLEFTD